MLSRDALAENPHQFLIIMIRLTKVRIQNRSCAIFLMGHRGNGRSYNEGMWSQGRF